MHSANATEWTDSPKTDATSAVRMRASLLKLCQGWRNFEFDLHRHARLKRPSLPPRREAGAFPTQGDADQESDPCRQSSFCSSADSDYEVVQIWAWSRNIHGASAREFQINPCKGLRTILSVTLDVTKRLIRTLGFPSLRFVLYRSRIFRIEIDFRGFETSSGQPKPFTFERD